VESSGCGLMTYYSGICLGVEENHEERQPA